MLMLVDMEGKGVLMKRLLIMLTWGVVPKNLIHFALKV